MRIPLPGEGGILDRRRGQASGAIVSEIDRDTKVGGGDREREGGREREKGREGGWERKW